MPVDHYENFPVASVLVPRRLRGAIEAIYWFARTADDIADEGDAPAADRLAALEGYRERLDSIEGVMVAGGAGAKGRTRRLDWTGGAGDAEQGGARHAVVSATAADTDEARHWNQLTRVIDAHRLPIAPFRDMIDAFSQDVVKARYATFSEIDSYCRRSANPVGRLLLHLFDAADERNVRDSDDICTALQLLNFCQDVAIDRRKDRLYIPLEELSASGVTIEAIDNAIVDARWQRLFAVQLERAAALLERGKPLALRLPGRFGLELRAIVAGGERIAARLRAIQGDVFRARPILGRLDWLVIGWRTLVPSRPASPAVPRPVLR